MSPKFCSVVVLLKRRVSKENAGFIYWPGNISAPQEFYERHHHWKYLYTASGEKGRKDCRSRIPLEEADAAGSLCGITDFVQKIEDRAAEETVMCPSP